MPKYTGEYKEQRFTFDGTEADFIKQCCALGAQPRKLEDFGSVIAIGGAHCSYRLWSNWGREVCASSMVSGMPFEEAANRHIKDGYWPAIKEEEVAQ